MVCNGISPGPLGPKCTRWRVLPGAGDAAGGHGWAEGRPTVEQLAILPDVTWPAGAQ